jgi:hypothetical protein
MPTRLAMTALLSLFAACSDSSTGNAVFTGRTQLQLARTVDAAASADVATAELMAVGYAGKADAPGCPQVVTSGTRLHVIGGCTIPGGPTISGEAYLTNVPGLLSSNDASQPAKAEFDQLVLANPDGTSIRFDGTVSWTATSTQVALEGDFAGLAARTDATIACTAGACSYSDATIAVDGVGSATVTGTWSTDLTSVALDVRGKDEMTISAANKCLSYAVNGASFGQICNN